MKELDRTDIKFKGGVLLIGSLMWGKSKLRNNWRNQNLDLESKILIRLPIRYGRVSQSRNCTFTMIFSSECKSEGKIGKGYLFPFKYNEISISDIMSQAKSMIIAEHNKEKELGQFHWCWGCLGLTINPKLLQDENEKIKVDLLMGFWEEKFGNGFNSRDYKVGNEESIVSKNGILKIDWQDEINSYDFVLGTATKPNVSKYPTPREIANRMIVKESEKYFQENRKVAISTFQDEEIELEFNNNFKK